MKPNTLTGSRLSSFLKHAETAVDFLGREDVQASLKKDTGHRSRLANSAASR